MQAGLARRAFRILLLAAASTPLLSLTLYAYDRVEQRQRGYERLAAKERGDRTEREAAARRCERLAEAGRSGPETDAPERLAARAEFLRVEIREGERREREYRRQAEFPRVLFAPEPYPNLRGADLGMTGWLTAGFGRGAAPRPSTDRGS